jgi:hypothetical protein
MKPMMIQNIPSNVRSASSLDAKLHPANTITIDVNKKI